MTQYDINIAIEPLESSVGLTLMFWNIPGVKNVFNPGMKLYLVRVFYPKCYIIATFIPDNDPIWQYYSNGTSRIIGRVEINDLEYPRGQKCFQPGDETVFGEGFTTQILHVLLIDSQFGGFWVAPLPTLPTKNCLWTVSKNSLRMVHLDSHRVLGWD